MCPLVAQGQNCTPRPFLPIKNNFTCQAGANLKCQIQGHFSWTEEPGRLRSMGSLRVGHDWATSLSLFTFIHWRRKWQPTPVFLPGESQGQRSLVDCRLWGAQSQTRLKRLSSSSSSSSGSLIAASEELKGLWVCGAYSFLCLCISCSFLFLT